MRCVIDVSSDDVIVLVDAAREERGAAAGGGGAAAGDRAVTVRGGSQSERGLLMYFIQFQTMLQLYIALSKCFDMHRKTRSSLTLNL